MNQEKIMKALQSKMQNSLEVGATFINTLSDVATPHWQGNLKRSKKIKILSWDQVQAVTGDEKTASYVMKQYNANLRHLGDRLTGYESFSAGFANGSGMGAKAQYGRGYKEQKNIAQKSRARWYHRVIEDKEMMRKVNTVVANVFRNN